jgi:lipopolysaccharide export LptBFGC system permease protein LptF
MFHTAYRTVCAACAALQVLLVFAFLGLLASAAAGDPAPLIVVVMFTLLFFAPAAWINAWDDIGD